MVKIKLKNSKDQVIVDKQTYQYLLTDPYLVEVDFIHNIRKHSSGCCVFQRNITKKKGVYQIQTLYLHKLIAEKFIVRTKQDRSLVGYINGDKLDCRVENLQYRTRAESSRNKRVINKTGYTGVYANKGGRFRAIIGVDGETKHLGMFATAEEAALAYNAASVALFGDRGKINVIQPSKRRKKKTT